MTFVNWRITLLLVLFSLNYLFTTNSIAQPNIKIDSLINLSTSQSGEDLCKTYLQLANLYRPISFDSILIFTQKAQDSYDQGVSNDSIQFSIWNETAYGHMRLGNYAETEKLLDLSIARNDSTEISALATAFTYYGMSYQFQQEKNKALDMYLKALPLNEAVGSPKGLYSNHINIGLLLYSIGNERKSLSYFHRCLRIAEENSMSVTYIVQAYYRLANAFNKISGLKNIPEELDSMIFYGKKGLEISKQANFQFGIIELTTILASPLLRRGHLEEGMAMAQKALELNLATNHAYNITLSKLNIGFAHELLNQPALGKKYALEVMENSGPLAYEAWRLLYLCEKKLGNHAVALDYLEKHKQYMDSAFYKRFDERVANVEAQYETEKKEQEIQNLQQQANIRELEVGQQRLIFAIAIALLVILAIVIYLIYRINKSKSAQASANLEQRLLRTQMNPHFIFNALGAIQNFMLKNDAQTAGIYLSKFSKLIRQILENSREEFITMAEEIEMLTNYLEVQQSRFNDAFKFNIQVSDGIDINTTSIPPMFAQPFLENAIEHGVSEISEQGDITISFSKEHNLINIEVCDNGKGLEAGSVQAKEHNSLAMVITKERMAIFGKNIRQNLNLAIDNIIDADGEIRGTQVKLNIPFIEN